MVVLAVVLVAVGVWMLLWRKSASETSRPGPTQASPPPREQPLPRKNPESTHPPSVPGSSPASKPITKPGVAQDSNSLKPQGYVSDFTHVLDPQSRRRIEDYCAQVERATGAQMELVTIDTLNGAPIEDFTGDLFRKWGIGKKGQDTGILYLLAIKDHKQRIEVGYGLGPILPDKFVGSVLLQVKPQLQQGQYGTAMLTVAEVIGGTIAKDKGVKLDTHLVQQPRTAEQP